MTYRVEKFRGAYIVVREDGKKIADFKTMADAYWFIDSQKPKHRRQAGDRDAQNT